ncbi:hypothetical protein C0Q70_13826 [Pomacea canaliculata]|uniref:Uncharacterized protein n=1 Tax=Pomacea canaliculata TaxID=400727 RepID=A0A2T7NYA3_POMCA|nr:hypothetical protein C0Q70_13826 [Pomacea canaliculata]
MASSGIEACAEVTGTGVWYRLAVKHKDSSMSQVCVEVTWTAVCHSLLVLTPVNLLLPKKKVVRRQQPLSREPSCEDAANFVRLSGGCVILGHGGPSFDILVLLLRVWGSGMGENRLSNAKKIGNRHSRETVPTPLFLFQFLPPTVMAGSSSSATKALTRDSGLEVIVEENEFFFTEVKDFAFVKTPQTPQRNTIIEKLNLEGNGIEHEGAKFLARILKENLYITELVLTENKLGNAGAKAICDLLVHNRCITKLDLSGLVNPALKHLRLAHNSFEEIGARCFKEALCENESLELLDLNWNHFSSRGAAMLAEGLEVLANYESGDEGVCVL